MICVEFQSGQLVELTTPASQCQSLLLMTPNEINQIVTFNTFFALPDNAVLAQFYFYGFALVIMCYMLAYFQGSIINWFNDKFTH